MNGVGVPFGQERDDAIGVPIAGLGRDRPRLPKQLDSPNVGAIIQLDKPFDRRARARPQMGVRVDEGPVIRTACRSGACPDERRRGRGQPELERSSAGDPALRR